MFLFLFISAQYALSMSALGMSRAHARTPDEKRRLGLIYLGVAARDAVAAGAGAFETA